MSVSVTSAIQNGVSKKGNIVIGWYSNASKRHDAIYAGHRQSMRSKREHVQGCVSNAIILVCTSYCHDSGWGDSGP